MGGLRRKNVSDAMKERVLKLLQAENNPQQVARKTGLSVSTVYKIQKSAKDKSGLIDKNKHWDDLVELCERIVSVCEYHESDLIYIDTIGELPEFEIDVVFRGKHRRLQRRLLDHLRAEIIYLMEPINNEEMIDLIGKNKADINDLDGLTILDKLPVKYINLLRDLAAKRMFKGTCDICKS